MIYVLLVRLYGLLYKKASFYNNRNGNQNIKGKGLGRWGCSYQGIAVFYYQPEESIPITIAISIWIGQIKGDSLDLFAVF